MPSQNEGPIIRPMRFAAQIADGQGGEACGSSARERERERERARAHIRSILAQAHTQYSQKGMEACAESRCAWTGA